MVQQQTEARDADRLDRTLSAIADPTRRGILERLGAGSATISELAEPVGISLTGLKKHVSILERAGLVATEKVGRTRRCSLGTDGLGEAELWIGSYRRMAEGRLDRLGDLLDEMDQTETDPEGGPR